MISKNEIEIEKIKSSTEKFNAIIGVIKHFLSICGVILSFKIMFAGLQPFLSSNPEVIKSIAVVIEKINFSNITSYLIACGTTTAWFVERKGKKRAIEEKGKYQAIAEKNDAYRSTSGLTETGDTPRRIK